MVSGTHAVLWKQEFAELQQDARRLQPQGDKPIEPASQLPLPQQLGKPRLYMQLTMLGDPDKEKSFKTVPEIAESFGTRGLFKEVEKFRKLCVHQSQLQGQSNLFLPSAALKLGCEAQCGTADQHSLLFARHSDILGLLPV